MTPSDEQPVTPVEASVDAESGCHAGAETLKSAAEAAGKSELLEQFKIDYPKGPHDQPQSMCPAFGSLRVGLRMRRTATVLSGSACCVYGLTFTSHFYGARRTVGYVPFNSESLVTGKLFEDIREAADLERAVKGARRICETVILEAFRQRFRPSASGPIGPADLALMAGLARHYPADVTARIARRITSRPVSRNL